MAKVKINSLPPGITIENGKIVKRMQKGGLTTGDQYDFGLTTTVKTPTNNSENTNNIRYSLNSVPRDQANIEAEGGETVLTDLNNDGLFNPNQDFEIDVIGNANKLVFDTKLDMFILG